MRIIVFTYQKCSIIRSVVHSLFKCIKSCGSQIGTEVKMSGDKHCHIFFALLCVKMVERKWLTPCSTSSTSSFILYTFATIVTKECPPRFRVDPDTRLIVWVATFSAMDRLRIYGMVRVLPGSL